MKRNRLINIMLIVTFANIIGKILGFVKNILFSYYYGANSMTDAFLLAESIPLLILGVFTSAADSAVIPQYNRISQQHGRRDADRNFSNILNIVTIIALCISLTILVYPQLFIQLFAPGFSMGTKIYAERFLSYFSFIGFFHIIYCFCCAYNAAHNKVSVRAVVSVVPNIVILSVLVIFHDTDMLSITVAYAITYFLSALIPFCSIYRLGYKHFWKVNMQSKELHNFIRIFLPIIGVALLSEIQLFVDRFLASGIYGGISYLNYASRITNIFDTVLVSGISLAVLPVLSGYNQSDNIDKLVKASSKIIKYLIIFLSILSCGCIVYSENIISLIYGRGEFDQSSIENVANILCIYGLDIVLFPIQTILVRIFHSMENTKLPFKVNCLAVIMNIIISFILSKYIGLIGIAIGTVISFVINIIVLLHFLIKKIGWSKEEFGTKHMFVIIFSLFISIVVMISIQSVIKNGLAEIFLGGMGGVFIYVLFLGLSLKQERMEILSYMRRDK